MDLNLDDKGVLDECCRKLKKPEAKNFCVSFNKTTSRCGINLDHKALSGILNEPSPADSQSVRWIHFWSTEAQQDSIAEIADKYGISRRIRGLLHLPRAEQRPTAATSLRNRGRGQPLSQTAPAANAYSHVVDELWHFNTVSRDARYLYIGCNVVCPAVEETTAMPDNSHTHAAPSQPFGMRMWTSTIVGNDGTIVSIVEDMPKFTRRDTLERAAEVIRQNIINIFRNLSLSTTPVNPATTLSFVEVRSFLDGEDQNGVRDATSMLCYYIFDDWYSTFDLITGKNNPYRRRLEDARSAMFKQPNIDLINSLHRTGQQLTRLKLIYQSYCRIIHQLLAFHATSQHQGSNVQSNQPLADINEEETSRPPSLLNISFDQDHVALTTRSLFRFERLLDHIGLLALAEIDDALREKESLVFMNFSLVALRESRAIERLSKITIVLAKVTIVFLPLGLMTDFFGMEMEVIKRISSMTTYWVSFAIVFLLAGLFVLTVGSTKSTRTASNLAMSPTARTSGGVPWWDAVREGWRKEYFGPGLGV